MQQLFCDGNLARITDFAEWLALLQAGSGFRKALEQDFSHPGIRGVPTGHPQHLRRRSKPLQEHDNIPVFTHDHGTRLPRRVKDDEVLGFSEPQVSHGMSRNSKGLDDPTGQGWDNCASIQRITRPPPDD